MKSKTLKILIGLIGVVVLYQGAKWGWGEASKAYFNYRCEQDGGEFIYRTVENVEGVFQMRPREQRDYITSLRNGNLLEDPYGHTDKEAQRPWHLFLRYPKGGRPTYTYFESVVAPDLENFDIGFGKEHFVKKPEYKGEPYWIYTFDSLTRSRSGLSYGKVLSVEQAPELKSKYGFTWQQIQNRWDNLFGVYGGELLVKELATDEILGVRRGYFIYTTWPKLMGGCPKGKHHDITFEFVSKVLKPAPYDDSILKEKIDGN